MFRNTLAVLTLVVATAPLMLQCQPILRLDHQDGSTVGVCSQCNTTSIQSPQLAANGNASDTAEALGRGTWYYSDSWF
ncbi:hypothetical protein H4R33_000152 [Dimargaris cristalligena]|nr:hypothetical protein H4R33_000152 [Dimargaris cristalligena]